MRLFYSSNSEFGLLLGLERVFIADIFMADAELKKIGRNIKRAREASGLTQSEVAKACRITTNYYARVERGERMPTLLTLKKIVDVLKLKSSSILPF